MAPITRSSLHGARSESQLAAQSFEADELESEDNQHVDEDADFLSDQDEEGFPFQTSTQEMLQPLQDTANRVSRQVEDFAKCLDRFNTERGRDDQELWKDAWQLLERYSSIAVARRDHTASKSPRSSPSRRGLGDTTAQIQKIQLEADLWILTKNLLVCNSPQSAVQAQAAREEALAELNRYSTNSELWNAFLDSDISGQEYECCLDWLQERAAQTCPPVEAVVADLTTKSERGDGSWSAGPMFTKNAIKKQKRDRAWPAPLDPSNPSLSFTLRRRIDNAPIVAQLDPDSQTRESAQLEPQDEFHEEAAWQTCWEMLRRGQTVEKIRSWWADRNEKWRSSVLRCCDPSFDQKLDSPWLRIINIASNAEFTSRCKVLCQSDVLTDDYQKAVYGLLCGDLSASRVVCNTIDDNLFSTFNAVLIERFQHYLASYKKKLADPSLAIYQPQPASDNNIRQYLAFAQTDETTKDEAREPHKLIEMAIAGKNFDTFFIQLGQAAAQIAHMTKDFDHLMERDDATPRDDCAQITAQDEDSVRIVAHLQLILQSLGLLDEAYKNNLSVMENNIANYIGWLEKTQKWTLIPLYASKLSKERTTMVLGAILIDITDQKERALQVRLMKHYNIDISDVAYGIFYLANYSDIHRFKDPQFKFTVPRITEYVGTGKVKQTKIKSAFMGGDPSPEEEIAIASVEWYRFITAENWGKACWSISLLYKLYLSEGKFGALRDLVRRANLGQISLNAFSINLQFANESGDGSENGDIDMDGVDEDQANPISPTRKRREQRNVHPLTQAGTSRQVLHAKSLVWLQLEQLVVALDALERWQDWADDVEANRSNTAQIRSMKRELRQALDEVRVAMLPLLDKDFLCQPLDDREAAILDQIRNHYIPECILAYNSVLYFAGHAISRTWLVECMELAQLVAQTPMLTNAFVESGRMRELMSAFALDSQALLQANEQGGSKSKKGKKENGMEIWQVSWRDQGPVDLEALD